MKRTKMALLFLLTLLVWSTLLLPCRSFVRSPLLTSRHGWITHSPPARATLSVPRLFAAAQPQDESNATYTVMERLGLTDKFEKWRFLQRFLDNEVNPDDANQVLHYTLAQYLVTPKNPRDDESARPELTDELRERLDSLLRQQDSEVGTIQALSRNEGGIVVGEASSTVLLELEKLLPDELEQEDASKSLWAVVDSLQGETIVRIQRADGDPTWLAIAMVCRVLIYFDFLDLGEPTSFA